MLDKCANPPCFATFRNLRDGRVFVTEVELDYQRGAGGRVRQLQYLWLCNSCCRTMTVASGRGKRIQVVPLSAPATAARGA